MFESEAKDGPLSKESSLHVGKAAACSVAGQEQISSSLILQSTSCRESRYGIMHERDTDQLAQLLVRDAQNCMSQVYGSEQKKVWGKVDE